MVGRQRFARAVVALFTATLALGSGVAGAHSGGTDSSGGHYCREAGYESGSCGPLNSYHSHSGGSTSGGSTAAPPPAVAVYKAAPSANSGRRMRARAMFNNLGIRREVKAGSYARAKFPHWTDGNGDGCDTREAVLISESRVRATRTAPCTVTAGRWVSAYDGAWWSDPSDVDIDHLVALKEAWVSGAHGWSKGNRRAFANDLRFRPALQAVTDNVNQSKSDRDPAEWLPSRARCKYAVNWVQVKHRWRLKLDRAEHAALQRLLSGDCGSRLIDVPKRAR